MAAAPAHRPAIGTQANSMSWGEDMSRIGLEVDPDGASVTVTHLAMLHLFGRPADHRFALTLSSTSLLRLRHLVAGGEDVLHLPIYGCVLTCDNEMRSTSRLIATAQYLPTRQILLEVTIWRTSSDGAEAWLDKYQIDNLTGLDLAHFDAVQAMWAVGVRPRSDAARYIAAGFSPQEARELHSTATPAARDAQIDLLIALRDG